MELKSSNSIALFSELGLFYTFAKFSSKFCIKASIVYSSTIELSHNTGSAQILGYNSP
jgi:hypothetical protein